MIIIHLVNDETGYLPRLMEARLERALRVMRVVVLTGGRQTGKTTLARRFGDRTGRRFWSFDSIATLELARREPGRLWEADELVTLDEVQRAPELLLEIKQVVDRSPRKGRFLLTGSANLLLQRGVSESLAGRAAHLTLEPFTWGESAGHAERGAWRAVLAAESASALRRSLPATAPSGAEDWSLAVFRGGLPETLRAEDPEDVELWRKGYIDTYLERDLRQQAQVADLPDFLRLMRLAALRTAGLLSIAELARDGALSVSTARRYVNLLEVCFQVRRVPAWSTARGRRLIKAPKLFWWDTGLACHLVGVRTPEDLARSPLVGALVETWALQQLAALCGAETSPPGLYHWRTAGGVEVDFVVELADRLLPIEVKAASRVGARDVAGLRSFLDEHAGRAPFGLLLHAGDEVLPLEERILAVPFAVLFGTPAR